MRRPEVSVVMPFAGDGAGARAAIEALATLDVEPGDELILVDNAGVIGEGFGADNDVTIVAAPGERSPAHARNVGAAHAGHDWILFLDADCRPGAGLLDAYFEEPVAEDTGALVGEVEPAPGAQTLAERYGAARSFLGQAAHLEHPYRPRAAAANLLVRRSAFEQVGGFYERVRAAEDTDFSWRLQAAGWRLEARPRAVAEHRYRDTLADLRRQWRGYAAGRAWLARRYEGFEPEPAVARSLGRAWAGLLPRVLARGSGGSERRRAADGRAQARRAPAVDVSALDRGRFLALDMLMGLEELAGLTLSNRPTDRHSRRANRAQVVLVADRFPARGDPFVELAQTLEGARVEALARPEAVAPEQARALAVDYLEDDGLASRLGALVLLIARHPLRWLGELAGRRASDPSALALAPAVMRLHRDAGARVHALGGGRSRDVAARLARLSGRPLDS